MKAPNIYPAIILAAGAALVMVLSQNAFAIDTSKPSPAVKAPAAQSSAHRESRDVRKVELEIDALRDKIIVASDAISVDRRKLKDAEKMHDKDRAAEIGKDIEKRETEIKDLKREIAGKKEQRYFLMNGKQKDEPRRTRLDAK